MTAVVQRSMPGVLPLADVRIIEGATFVAAPSAGLVLAQLGADVIRVDPPGGGSDFQRWPLAPSGKSLFWAGMNKGKRSVAIDFRSDQGRELLMSLATAPGAGSGVFVDNLVGRRRPTYDELKERRADVIHVHVEGRRNGRPAVDYTINAEVGVPLMTGPHNSQAPVNHVVPAWDLLTGMNVAMCLIAALRNRDHTGTGAELELALGDVALAGVGNMGWLAEVEAEGRSRRRHGNHMFGSFGVDFETADGRRLMVVALTEGQWRSLRSVTQTTEVFSALEKVLDVNLDLEADRYQLRETIAGVLNPWFGQRDFETVRALLDEAQVLWSPYLDMSEVAAAARREHHPLVGDVEQPGIGSMLATGRALRWDGLGAEPVPAPVLGEHTESVLSEVLGLSSAEIGRLHDGGVVACAPTRG